MPEEKDNDRWRPPQGPLDLSLMRGHYDGNWMVKIFPNGKYILAAGDPDDLDVLVVAIGSEAKLDDARHATIRLLLNAPELLRRVETLEKVIRKLIDAGEKLSMSEVMEALVMMRGLMEVKS